MLETYYLGIIKTNYSSCDNCIVAMPKYTFVPSLH